MKKYSVLFILILTIALAVGCNAPFSANPADRTRDTVFSVDVRWQAGGVSSGRGIMNDPLVASVRVDVLGSGGIEIGSGSLHTSSGYWSGFIQVTRIGPATFLASAKDADGAELYYGEKQQTLTGENDQVTIMVARQVRGSVTTFTGTPIGADGVGSVVDFTDPRGITTDGTNLYVTDSLDYTIRKIVILTGEVNTLAGTAGQSGYANGVGSAARFLFPNGITTDGTNLYVTDTHMIRKIDISTAEVSYLAGNSTPSWNDGTGGSAYFNSPNGITTDGTNLYVADTDNHSIRKIVISSGTVTTLAGSTGYMGSTDGTGSEALFNSPSGIVIIGNNLYVADTGNNTIRKIVISTKAVTTLAGTAGLSGSTNGAGSAALFSSPGGITTAGANLYVTDCGSTIRKIVISTKEVTTLAGAAAQFGETDGAGSAARFNGPCGITTVGTDLYTADSNNDKIRKIAIATSEVTTVTGIHTLADGIGRAARFIKPEDVTTDGTNLYVTDYQFHKIRKIAIATSEVATLPGTYGSTSVVNFEGITTDGTNLYMAESFINTIIKTVISTGEATTLAGGVGGGGWRDGTGSAALFNGPEGITTDGTNLYVADTYNYVIRKIIISTAEVTTLAGKAGYQNGTDGTGIDARFFLPMGITTDGTNLYVTDYWTTIRKIVIATGEVTTLAGKAQYQGVTDGKGSAARFSVSNGLTTDGTNLYVADTYNHTIRKIVISTAEVTTLAGTARSSGSTDGMGSAALFNTPFGIAMVGTNLYVTDSGNNTIRKIQ